MRRPSVFVMTLQEVSTIPAWILQKFLAKPLGVKGGNRGQLQKCREIDYRVKGYRPPQSRITSELSDTRLAFHNFEWLASSAHSLQTSLPELRNRIVKI